MTQCRSQGYMCESLLKYGIIRGTVDGPFCMFSDATFLNFASIFTAKLASNRKNLCSPFASTFDKRQESAWNNPNGVSNEARSKTDLMYIADTCICSFRRHQMKILRFCSVN